MRKIQNLKELVSKSSIEEKSRPVFSRPEKDIPASIVVFLVALPLCLGIALASGAPLISGLISGVIGGLVIGTISKSGTSVSGPAASLTAVNIGALKELGSFEIFLLALLIGGFIQLLFGVLKAGLIADYMPTSVIKGLLAAIGVILIFTQIPHAFGLDTAALPDIDITGNIKEQLKQWIQIFFQSVSPGAIVLSLISLFLLVFWDKTRLKKIPLLPPSLVVVILGVILNFLFLWMVPSLYLDGEQLVRIPDVGKMNELVSFPDFSEIGNLNVWNTAFSIALVASIATLLNVEATDNIDPHKRRTPPNRELIAQGVGNALAGLIGGIPITSVIVRSTVNISAGSATKLSTILHGLFLLVSVLFISSVINMIPLASLAVILLVVGYNLASVSVFKGLFKKGWTQFIPFIVTIVGIVATDVLLGVLIGTSVSVFFLLRSNYYNPFFIENAKFIEGETIKLELSNEVSFLNKASIKKTLWSVPPKSKVFIDASFSSYVDQDVVEILHDFQDTFAKENEIEVSIIGLKESYDLGEKIDFEDRNQVRKVLEKSTPQQILDFLKEGNKRYMSGDLVSRRLRNKDLTSFINESPLAVVINCIDMREPLNMLMNTGIGDLIPIRSAGNVANKHIIHSIEVACRKQGAKLILFMGNSENSFIREALEQHFNGQESYLMSLLEPALDSGELDLKQITDNNPNGLVNEVTLWNLQRAKLDVLEHNPYIREQVKKGQIGVASAFFDRKSGDITFSELEKA